MTALWLAGVGGTGCGADEGKPGSANDATIPNTAEVDVSLADTAESDAAALDTAESDAASPEDGLAVNGTEAAGAVAPTAALSFEIEGATDVASVHWVITPPFGPGPITLDTPATSMTYTATFVGPYRVDATVVDHAGGEHVARSFTIVIAPPNGLYVQLSWDTPEDVDQTDTGGDQIYFSVGSDMDLHLLHPEAYGKYFDFTYDCYWDDINPEWGILGAADNPRLDRDDTDGAGPEAISLAVPEPGVVYTVGVHYWNDWGYGRSNATLRVYWDGELADEWAGVAMDNDDMWIAYTIAADGSVTRNGDVPQIVPGYRGFGPTSPTLSVSPGRAVQPGTTLTLSVEPTAGMPSAVDWSVAVSGAAEGTQIPSGPDPLTVSYTVATIGTYTFTAIVHSSDTGPDRVLTLTALVVVAQGTDLRVELTWHTPGDPDETDLAFSKDPATPVGSDLDLHLRLDKADVDWFDWTYDCSWQTPAPEWGIFSPADNPTLLGDDYDGGGPEVITMAALAPGQAFEVGVHYWSDHGFGDALATLRVFLNGALQDEWRDVDLSNGDLWDAFTIVDDSVSRVGTTPAITHAYPVPVPFQP